MLTDSVNEDLVYTFNLEVTCFAVETPLEPKTIKKFPLPPPRPFIKELNQIGLVRIGFSRNLFLPTFARFPEFNKTDHMQ